MTSNDDAGGEDIEEFEELEDIELINEAEFVAVAKAPPLPPGRPPVVPPRPPASPPSRGQPDVPVSPGVASEESEAEESEAKDKAPQAASTPTAGSAAGATESAGAADSAGVRDAEITGEPSIPSAAKSDTPERNASAGDGAHDTADSAAKSQVAVGDETSDVADAEPDVQTRTGPLPDPLPIEEQLQIPTVIDLAVAAEKAERAGGVEPRAERLALDIEHAAHDKKRTALLAYELGELRQRRLDDEPGAIKAFDQALRADPTLRPNLWAIRRLIFRRQLRPKLVKLLEAEIRVARDDVERAELLSEKAQEQTMVGDAAGARASLEQAVALDSANVLALMCLERVGIDAGDEALLARVWQGLADCAANPGRKLAYLLDLIEMHVQRHLAQSGMTRSADPAADEGAEGEIDAPLSLARQLLVEAVALAPEAGATDRVARERERLAQLSGDPVEMLAALEARVAAIRAHYGPAEPSEAPAAPREPNAPLDRSDELRLRIVALRRRQARVARDQAKDPERAWGYLEQALALAGNEPLVLADLAELAEALGKFGELAELCRGWESLEGDPARSMSLSLRRAEALLRGGQREQARELLSGLSASAPGFLPITALGERDALAQGDWRELAIVYRDAAEAAQLGTTFGPSAGAKPDLTGAAAYYVAAADLYANYLEAPDEARPLYEKALEVAPGWASAVEGFSALLERTGDLEEATALLELQSESGDIPTRAHLLRRLSTLHLSLGRPERSVAVLRRLLALEPDNVDLRWQIDEVLASQPPAQTAASRSDLLVELSELTTEPAQRVTLLLQAARLCEFYLSDRARAIGLCRAALELSPGDRYARSALVAALRAAGDWQGLAAARRDEVAQLSDGPALTAALRELGTVLAQHLGKPDEAVSVYQELLERSPNNRFAAFDLAAMLAESNDWDGLVELLERLSVDMPDTADTADTADEQAAPESAGVDDGSDPGLIGQRGLLETAGDTAPGAPARDGAIESAATQLYMFMARALERGGRTQDAMYAFQRASELAPADLAAPLAVAELAATSGDATTESEALAQLATRTGDAMISARLWEEVGWIRAIELEDFELASEGFASALAADAGRQGAALGVWLMSAKIGDATAASDAQAGLADVLHDTRAASALLLRAGAQAEVAGDLVSARSRVARASATTPDEPGSLVASSESMPPCVGEGIDAGDAAGALVELQRRASIFAMRASITSDPVARDDWELDQADALEAAGKLAESGELVSGVLGRRADNLRALQLLRRLCVRGGDRRGLATASVALARVLGDSRGKLSLLREAAAIFDSELNDVAASVAIYRHILDEDGGATEFARLLELYRQHQDLRGLVDVLTGRINWLEQDASAVPNAAVTLRLERSLLRSGIGDKRGAVRDLETLLATAPDNSEALHRLASLHAEEGRGEDAAKVYRRFLAVETDPSRLADAELALSHILAEDMQDIEGAIAQVDKVLDNDASDVEVIEVRERLIGLLLVSGDWKRGIREIRNLAKLRSSNVERARDELRVATILAERMEDKGEIKRALERARQLDPLNLDAVRELAEHVGERKRGAVLNHAASDVRVTVVEDPTRPALYERLSVIARWSGDSDGRFFALSALGSLSTLTSEQKQFQETQRRQLHRGGTPSKPIANADWLSRIGTGGSSAGRDVWQIVSDAASRIIGLDAAKLGFERSERLAAKTIARDYKALRDVMACFAVPECDVYISENKPGFARSVSGAKPVLLLGSDIARASSASARFMLGRVCAMAREGTGTLVEMRPDELVGLFAAAAKLAGVQMMPDEFSGVLSEPELAERARILHKAMSRRDRRNLLLMAPRMGEVGEPARLKTDALRLAARAGLLVCADLDAALAVLDVGRGARALRDEPNALSLLAWAVGDDHMALRHQLEMSGNQ